MLSVIDNRVLGALRRAAEVFPKSGAAKAGMKSGDRIVVTVRRGDKQLDLSVELGGAG